jgi:hypothetical protein
VKKERDTALQSKDSGAIGGRKARSFNGPSRCHAKTTSARDLLKRRKYWAVIEHLPEELKPAIQTAYNPRHGNPRRLVGVAYPAVTGRVLA